ncbi:MAG: acyl carrier protein [Candidatus Omnitrophota bacterium]|jgi:acyl carrier protein
MGNNFEKEVKEMLSRMTGFDTEEIGLDMEFVKDLGIDSLKIIEIATAIEKTYEVTVPDRQLMQLRTVREAVKLIQELLTKKTKRERK